VKVDYGIIPNQLEELRIYGRTQDLLAKIGRQWRSTITEPGSSRLRQITGEVLFTVIPESITVLIQQITAGLYRGDSREALLP
jgi:hypothetical protein